MKAWKIECEDIDSHGCCVVFAESRSDARKRDSRDCDCEFTDIRVVRARGFDSLAPGPISTQDYLQRGWFFWCSYCCRQLYSGDKPIVILGHVFCNSDCVEHERGRWTGDTSKSHGSVVELCRALDEFLATSEPGGEGGGNATG